MEDRDLKILLSESLLMIDDSFVEISVPIKDRPYRATMFILKHCFSSLRGEGLEKYEDNKYYTDTPLFSSVSNYVHDWYEKRYGESVNESALNLYGIVFFRNCPFAIKFPYSMSVDEGDPDTISVKFLDKFNELEKWEDYILSPPNFKEMSNSEYEDLKRPVIESVEINRNIFYNIVVGESVNANEVAFSRDVFLHLKSATHIISSPQFSTYNLSVWELHMAIEKTIKLILVQMSKDYPKSHDLNKLFQLISEDEKHKVILDDLKSFPNSKEIISIRYGDPGITDISFARKMYCLTLKVISDLSGLARKKEINVRNGTIFLKRPKYAGAKFA